MIGTNALIGVFAILGLFTVLAFIGYGLDVLRQKRKERKIQINEALKTIPELQEKLQSTRNYVTHDVKKQLHIMKNEIADIRHMKYAELSGKKEGERVDHIAELLFDASMAIQKAAVRADNDKSPESILFIIDEAQKQLYAAASEIQSLQHVEKHNGL